MVDRIFAACWLLLTLGTRHVARTYEAQFSYEPIGPRAFPLLLAGHLGRLRAVAAAAAEAHRRER